MQPLISAIIAVYNCEKYIKEAIESILAQKYEPLEIIVVDDGSTDNTASIIKSFGSTVQYYYQENAGQVSANNFGIGVSKGSILSFNDADDLWAENKIALLLPHLLENPQYSAVLGEIKRFWIDEHDKKHFLKNERAHHFNTGLFRRALFEESVGSINSELIAHYDIEWFLRLGETGLEVKYIQDAVGYYRRHGENMSNNYDEEKTNSAMLKLLHDKIKRKREANK